MKKEKKLLPIIFILIILISIFLFDYGNDFYWHLKIGEYIFRNHNIPITDIFSWYASSNHLTWISHEWLFEVIIYLFYTIFSHYGAYIYVGIMLVFIGISIWNLNKEKFIQYPFYTICWALCGTLMFVNKSLPRPHLFSFLFFSITIYIAFSIYKKYNKKLLYFIPLISLLWSNIHGGSSNLSYIIYGIFLLYFLIKKNFILSKKYFFAFVVSFITILINPHGMKMIIYPYLNMTYNVMLNCIDEWQSLTIFSIDGLFYIIFIIFILFTIFKNRKKINLLEIFLFLIFIVIGIKSTRLMPYLYILASAIIPHYWNSSKINISLLPILCSLIVMIICFYTLVYERKEFQIVSSEMIDYLDNNNIILYNSYNLGGYLIYKEIPVFVDSRADLYIDTILCDVCQIEKENKTNILEKYNFNTFLVENNSYPYSYLSNNSKYQLVMKDKNNSLFILKPES